MTTEPTAEKKGLVDAADRMLRELMRTPRFKESLIILLSNIDPHSARSLARTLFWEDPGVILSLFGALPDLINVLGEFLAEAVNQMRSLPLPLMQDFMRKIVAGVDGEAFGEAAGGLLSMSLELGEEGSPVAAAFDGLKEGFRKGFTSVAGEDALVEAAGRWMKKAGGRAKDKDSSTYRRVRMIAELLQENPDFVQHVLRPVLAPATRAQRKRAASQKKTGGPSTRESKTAEKSGGEEE
jgi:hypothetical protein